VLDDLSEHFLVAALPVCGFHLQHEVGRRQEAYFQVGLGGPIAQGKGKVRFADPGRSEQNHILGPGDKRQAGQRSGPVCLNNFSAILSGITAESHAASLTVGSITV